LSDVECYTCHQKERYSNKCPQRQPGTALETRQDGKLWCSHHNTNTHSTEECSAGSSISVERHIRVPGKQGIAMVDQSIDDWSDNKKAMYQRPGVQMVLGGRVTRRIREHVAVVFKDQGLSLSSL
jgi:hypothetical protein